MKFCRLCAREIKSHWRKHFERQHPQITKEEIDKFDRDGDVFLKENWGHVPYPHCDNWYEYVRNYPNVKAI